MGDENKPYSAVPPPASLTSAASAPVNFNDALSKARAIAEKLKQQSAAAPAPPAAYSASAGSKRSYQDDSYDNDPHERSHGSHYNDYYNDRESKRSAYDRGSSRPYSSSGNESRRYGLGSDERKSMSAYGPSSAGSIIQEECSVPNHIVGLVIGKGGENLKKIERMSGAKVQFMADTGDMERRVNMTGEADQVKIAKDMIQQVVDDARMTEAARHGGRPETSSMQGSMGASRGNGLTMTIPSTKVGLVIGRGGETIRDLEERSGAKITVVPETPGEQPLERNVNLVGDSAAVQRAKQYIDEIVNEDTKSVAPSRDWTAYRQQHYPADDSRRGYGRGEETGAESGSRPTGEYHGTGANAPMNRYGPSSGGQDRAYGGGFRGRFNEEFESIKVPRTAVGFIIGRGGETVHALEDQSGARIKVDPNAEGDANERTINISGNADAIALAKKLVMEKVAEGNANRGGYGGGRFGGDRHRGGGYNSRGGYGGRYGQGYSSQYQEGSDANAGYDYSQYQQYYGGQYGYDASQYGQATSGSGQDSNTTGAADASQQGYQYSGYPYGYGGYGQYPAEGATTTAPAATSGEQEAGDAPTEPVSSTDDKEGSTNEGAASTDAAASKNDQAASYYGQYYGDQSQWSQEAYYQWYQQYYGGQYGAYDPNQQQQPRDGQSTEATENAPQTGTGSNESDLAPKAEEEALNAPKAEE
ncbi:hypothetical protein EC973_001451 [Apophysomyces ossiformis]|uniref:K Homology domain-containing protein n=1 Tax=Apophysomyces ossiformis TaxID=679940 RepID=A0A8H7BQ03_9FUNG|nr:hypothetical protein EC973_001451 [Apophysomyces ossiformis]